MKTHTQTQSDFKGFDDFVEVFRAGTHVDSQGNKQTWSVGDLDQMVANHNPAPIVIGHPKTNHPAYGWTERLQRVGNVLQAKFTQVEPQFSKMVEDGRFKNRSIRIVKTDKGLSLGHVGFLGAQPPAITGLSPIEFNQTEQEYFDFECDWRTPSTLAMMMRNMREFIITKFSLEDADKVIPNYQIDDLTTYSEQQRQEDIAEDANKLPEPSEQNTISNFSKGTSLMPNPNAQTNQQTAAGAEQPQTVDFAQHQTLLAELDAERKKNRRIECQSVIDGHIARGVKPAALEGATDFMMNLSTEAASFEFSQGTGDKVQTVKTSQFDFFKTLLNQIPATVKFGETDFSGEVKSLDTTEAIVKAAEEFQFSENQAGRHISVSDAVAHVMKGAK